jgi:hypothetical protein
LSGDLDDVDMIEDVEEGFGFRFSDDELGMCETVGDLYALVERRLVAKSLDATGCATAICFYSLRRALQPLVEVKLRPQTPIASFEHLPVRKLYRLIKQDCGLRPPFGYLSGFGCVTLASVSGLPLAGLAFGWPWWAALLSALLPIIGCRLVPLRLPPDVHTFGDLVRVVSSRSIGTLSQRGARLRSQEAWTAFRDIISDHTVLAKDAITPETLLMA